jgi:hypothetical protein
MHYNQMRLARKRDLAHTLRHSTWHQDIEAAAQFEGEYQHMDAVVKLQRFGKLRLEDVKSEDFGVWARRRIEEMRRVKEDRLRSTSAPVSRTPASLSLATTLPIEKSDIYAHYLLSSALSLSKHEKNYLRSKHIPLFPVIHGFAWFGEYSWAWHRNASGCWEVGYAGCGACAFPCSCCCAGNGSMYYGCACEEWRGVVAPEETQRCALVEWVVGELWDVMLAEEEQGKRGETVSGEVGEFRDWVEEWDVVSDIVSDGWSVVSVESEFEVV